MNWVITGIALYLTYYTFMLSKTTWKGGNKPAGVIIMIMAACFLPLSYWLNNKG